MTRPYRRIGNNANVLFFSIGGQSPNGHRVPCPAAVLIAVVSLAVGLVMLLVGAEGLVRGAASLASRFRVSPLVIGLTVVAFGTSAPELTVNLIAAVEGSADIGIGNVVGSNIANILLILGVSSLIVPLTVKHSTVSKEIPLALLGVVLLFIMGNDQLFDGVGFNAVTRTDGLALMSLFIIFVYYITGLARAERSEQPEIAVEEEVTEYGTLVSAAFTVGGLAGLVIGGRLLIDGAVTVAESAGLSEALIGLTIVAIGTSLPELATSAVAALRGHADIAIGNVIGSNIFNVFWVLGLTSTIIQLPFNLTKNVDVLVSIGSTALLFGLVFIGKRRRLERWQGAILLVLYATYLVYLVQRG